MTASEVLSISAPGATLTVTWHDGRAQVTVTGEFDDGFAVPARPVVDLVAEQGRPVDVDHSAVRLLCAAGVNWLASLHARAGADVRVVAASEAAASVLELCGIPMTSSAPGARPGRG